MDTRPIFSALTERLVGDLGSAVARVSRQNLSARAFGENQPALVVLATSLGIEGGVKSPVTRELGAMLVLHTRVSGADEKPDEQVLDLVARIEGALQWRKGEPRSDGVGYWTTLNGVVLRASLESAVIEDDQADVSQVSTTLHVSMLVRG